MNRPANAALKTAGIILALSGLGGALAGCGGSDSDGAPADASKETSKSATKEGFCEKLNSLSAAVAGATADDASKAIEGLKDWVEDIVDYGTPSELAGDARQGFDVLIAMFKGVDADATLEDLQKLGTDAPAADTEKVQALSAWTTENCTPAAPSDDAS